MIVAGIGSALRFAALNEQSLPEIIGKALYRGPERVRTAVEAFAELCLATRPQDLI